MSTDDYELRTDRASFWAKVAAAIAPQVFAAEDESRDAPGFRNNPARPDKGPAPQPDSNAGGRG